ncbi:MAG: thiosulfate/3-mercaptopyruvate sulfurtransferase [Planctomycetota bacterium]|jgi:3-mercaptopyruvate sulfurtransferase SseA
MSDTATWNHRPSSTRASLSAIGFTALCLGVGVFWAQGSKARDLGGRSPGAQAASWAPEVERGAEHITPTELTEALRTRPSDFLLIDVRPASEFAAFHLPGAASLDLPELLGDAGEELLRRRADRTVVLYSNGMVHPAQAWVALVGRGHTNVRVLEGGLAQLRADVLTPPSLRPGYDQARARNEAAAYQAARELFFAPPRPSFESYATDPAKLTSPTVVSTTWVAGRGAEITLVDTRGDHDAYLAEHLPGAIHVSVANTRVTTGELDRLLPPAQLASVLSAAGIGAEDEVVVYADEELHDATHLLLALRTLGHKRMALMEGGLGTWTAEGRETESGAIGRPKASYEPGNDAPDISVEFVEVIDASSGTGAVLMDGRPTKNFTGKEETQEPRAGHIPQALDRPVGDDVMRVDGGVFFRSRTEVLAGYKALGVDSATPMIAMCRTGHQASQTWFLLHELLGYDKVKWYDGSWQEWSRHVELPVALGDA